MSGKVRLKAHGAPLRGAPHLVQLNVAVPPGFDRALREHCVTQRLSLAAFVVRHVERALREEGSPPVVALLDGKV